MTFLRRQSVWAILGVALVALFAPAVASAQTGKIAGVVTDSATGRPVEGVNVVITGTQLGAITQANGRYFIISVPPGTYSVSARRLGYRAQTKTGVQVIIDNTREVNYSLSTANQQLTALVVRAEQTPLVERGQVGSSTVVTAEQIQALPVTSISGVLALQQGFVETPQNTQVISVAEEQRSTTQPLRVRGSRGGSTLAMIDGIPVNNPVFGNAAIDLNSLAVSQIDFKSGHMDPQYGNALSGVINNALREGQSEVAGSLDFQNSTLPGAIFNSAPDRLLGSNILRGFLSGPVPGTSTKLRYAISGQVQSEAARVLQYDNNIFSVNTKPTNDNVLPPSARDLIGGWRAFGGRQNQQIVGKMTFIPASALKVSLTGIGQTRQTRNFDRRYFYSYTGDPLAAVNNRADSLFVLNDANNRINRDLAQSTVRDQSNIVIGSAESRFGRAQVQVRVANLHSERQTCPIFLGTCIPGPFFRPNFDQGFLSATSAGVGVDRVPYTGVVDGTFGGEKFTSQILRADAQSQVTDHHDLQFGGQFTRHDIVYSDIGAFGGNSGIQPTTAQVYRSKPIEFASYLQDKIEYDFLTIQLGARFDYGVAKGRGFANPFDPTNGTTARDVCEGATVGGQKMVQANGQPYGTSGCLNSAVNPANQKPVLLDSATHLAQLDDFAAAKARSSFSPRIGVSFPLTEASQVFFNAGRYTMIPLYGNVYRNTGIGTVAGTPAIGGDDYCAANQTKPGTGECVPNIGSQNPSFVGNPNLLLEKAIQYEVGYSAMIGRLYAIQAVIFNRDESGLSGVRLSRASQDIGSTYDGSLPQYSVLVNGDFLSSRGIELKFQRQLSNHWSYNVNYGWSRATTNSPPPDRTNEISKSGERPQLLETLADVDRSHNLNLTFTTAFNRDVPKARLGYLLKNTSASLTYQFSSGFPYSPQRGFSAANIGNQANQAEINSARMPNTNTVNLNLNKGFAVGNVRYSGFLRVTNLLDTKNCVQVFVNTGNCDQGLQDFANRRVGNTGDQTTSTAFDHPEYVGARRSLYSGIKVDF